jgi:hypothetical protein
MYLSGLVCWWPDAVCWLHRQPGVSVASDHWHPLEIYGRALAIKKTWLSKKKKKSSQIHKKNIDPRFPYQGTLGVPQQTNRSMVQYFNFWRKIQWYASSVRHGKLLAGSSSTLDSTMFLSLAL